MEVDLKLVVEVVVLVLGVVAAEDLASVVVDLELVAEDPVVHRLDRPAEGEGAMSGITVISQLRMNNQVKLLKINKCKLVMKMLGAINLRYKLWKIKSR